MKDKPEYLLHRLVMEMDKVADKILFEHFGLSYNRCRFLAVLQHCGTITQHDLAVILGYSDPAVSKMLLELSKEGYVLIKTDPTHGRKRLVKITPKADKLTTEGTKLLNTHFSGVMKRAKVDSKQYSALTQKILEALMNKD